MPADRQARWYARAKADPAFLAKRAARERARRAAIKASPHKAAAELAKALERQRRRRGSDQRAAPFAGSVLAASAQVPGRDVLAQVTALAPRHEDREDVIGEAVLLALEGMAIPAAITEAKRRVSRAGSSRFSVPVEACPWL